MNEEELKEKEAELTEKDEQLKLREEELQKRNEDIDGLVKQIKDEYDAKLLKQHDAYEKRLNEREKVIKQLLSSDGDANTPKPTIIDKINARRIAQNKKW